MSEHVFKHEMNIYLSESQEKMLETLISKNDLFSDLTKEDAINVLARIGLVKEYRRFMNEIR